MIPISFWKHKREEQVKDDLPVIHGVAGDVGHKPVPELGQGPVPARVDVKVADDDGVEAVGVGRPLQHRLEPDNELILD